MLKPKLRPGALVVCDNTGQFKTEYRDFLEYVRDPRQRLSDAPPAVQGRSGNRNALLIATEDAGLSSTSRHQLARPIYLTN